MINSIPQSNCGGCKANLGTISKLASKSLKKAKTPVELSGDYLTDDLRMIVKSKQWLRDFDSTLVEIGSLAKLMGKDPQNKTQAETIQKISGLTLESTKKAKALQTLGAYQGALEVISALNGSLTPGVIPHCAAKVLAGSKFQISYHQDEDDLPAKINENFKNSWMYGIGAASVALAAKGAGCEKAYRIVKENRMSNKEALETIKNLHPKKNSGCEIPA